ncbi:3-oxoacyl-ACP reductase FabG [Georgenia sp. Z1344]|uniref:3-oxoacyl-ACP reductase FabG n=1 Tax=Georgenia sp. Z1344 TaxID=3416706 RepID=UPI003CF75BD6
MFTLTDKIAIVTGGASGIGRGIAERLVEAGATVVVADIDDAKARATAEEIGASAEHVDVTDAEKCRALVNRVVEQHGRLDIFCSNTGIFPQASIADMTEEQWDTMHSVNLKGTFLATQPALAQMRTQGHGRLVITSSITGSITGYPGWAHYGASKAGQQGFMRSAALEYAKDGITVNAVLPGNVLSEGLKAQGEEYLAAMSRSIPMHRLGDPKDIGAAAVFLASDEAAYITGQTIIVDGGQILPEEPDAIL